MPKWRDTLFIWNGSLKDGKWDGGWLGVDSADAQKAATPTAQEFADSPNKFTVAFELPGGGMFSPTTQIQPGTQVSATAGDGYLLDQGDGHARYKDGEHRLHFFTKTDADFLVAARGRNEFAPFVSLGKYQKDGQLVLARRYLDEKDARVEWTLDDLVAAVTPLENCSEPWRCEALHSKIVRRGKAATKRKAPAAPAAETSKHAKQSSSSANKARSRKACVRHLVLMKFKSDCSAEALEQAKQKLLLLQDKVPGIIKITFGDTFTHDRSQVHVLLPHHHDAHACTTYKHAHHLLRDLSKKISRTYVQTCIHKYAHPYMRTLKIAHVHIHRVTHMLWWWILLIRRRLRRMVRTQNTRLWW